MALHLDLAPFVPQYPVGVNNKGAALNAHVLLAIQGLFLDDVEIPAQGFFRIGNQVKREAVLGLEVFLAFQAVA